MSFKKTDVTVTSLSQKVTSGSLSKTKRLAPQEEEEGQTSKTANKHLIFKKLS